MYNTLMIKEVEIVNYEDDNMTFSTSTGKKTIKTVTYQRLSCHKRARLVSKELDGNYISGFARQNNRE